jgi:hypothetical protein
MIIPTREKKILELCKNPPKIQKMPESAGR